MPRYIDADALIEVLEAWKRDCAECDCESEAGQAIFDCICQIQDTPTADVVPKSEYDRMEKLFNDMTQEAKGYLNRIYGIRAEVAREIIDKIESVMFDRFSNIMLGEDIRLCLAELKKKYTEGEPNGSK